MENNEKEVLFSVSHLKKYFQVGNHATLKAGSPTPTIGDL